MIKFDKGSLEIAGTNLEVMTDFNFILDELIHSQPEIVVATFYARSEQLNEYASKCNSDKLNFAIEVVETVVKHMEEMDNE